MQPSPTQTVDASLDRAKAFLSEIQGPLADWARKANLDAKTLKLARQDGWNPTADTLRKIERLIPPSWRPREGREE